MARIKIAKPESEKVFSTDIALTVNFINYGGHMGNDAILTLCQEARLRYMDSLEMNELNFHGHSLIQADAAIVFKNEGFRGDQLTFDIFMEDHNSYGFDFVYEITRGNDLIARAKTGMVFFNYDDRKIVKSPIYKE